MLLYTVPAVASALAGRGAGARVLRTGLFRRVSFWVAYGICLFFQVLVDGG
jgi:hypothetical protein